MSVQFPADSAEGQLNPSVVIGGCGIWKHISYLRIAFWKENLYIEENEIQGYF